MYNANEIKVECSNKLQNRLCYACMSSDRELSSLGRLADIYRKICDSDDVSEVYLCWECTAMLKKVKLFKDRVDSAQKVLQLLSNCTSNFEAPQCLSNLTYSEVKIETFLFTEIDKKVDIEIKPLTYPKIELEINPITVKKELEELKPDGIEICDDPFDECDNNDDEIKETKPIKKNKTLKKKSNVTPRKLAYRTILNPTKIFSEAVTQEKIEPKDLSGWLERERNSEYYTNTKSKCDKCLRRITRGDSLAKHNKMYHCKSLGPYTCDICQTHFPSKKSVINHMWHHYLCHRCTLCGYRCYGARHMHWHARSHRKTVQCLACDACYSDAWKFFEHFRTFHMKFICDYCGKTYKSKKPMEKHMLKFHGPPEIIECKLCNVKFKEKRTLASHNLLKHAGNGGEASFCVRCDRQFETIALFRRHVNTSVAHADERHKVKQKQTVACPVCGKQYANKKNMLNHQRYVHLKQSRYYCQECDKSFLNRSRLVEHRRVHHEGYVKQKDKMCSVCGRGFTENRILECHMRTHTGERPFACAHCDAKFAQRGAMTAHVKAVHLKCPRRNLDMADSIDLL